MPYQNDMKAILLLAVSNISTTTLAQSQSTGVPDPSLIPDLSIIDRNMHTRTWAQLTWETNEFGKAFCLTNVAYTEPEIGMHRRNPADGTWIESTKEISIQPTGGALGQNGQHR